MQTSGHMTTGSRSERTCECLGVDPLDVIVEAESDGGEHELPVQTGRQTTVEGPGTLLTTHRRNGPRHAPVLEGLFDAALQEGACVGGRCRRRPLLALKLSYRGAQVTRRGWWMTFNYVISRTRTRVS